MIDEQKAVLLAATLLVAGAHADDFGAGSNQFSMAFVEIGATGNPGDPANPYNGTTPGSVDYSYRIGTFEVSVDQFSKAMAMDSRIGDGDELYWNDGTRTVGLGAPASMVSWYEAAKFANWLTSGDAYAGAYSFDTNGLLTAVDRVAAVATYGTVYVLPSEDEWYKAAYYKPVDDGSFSLYSSGGNGDPPRGTNGWNYSVWTWEGSNVAHTVKSPPDFMWEGGFGAQEQNGTFDINGNIWEWCESAHDGTLDDLAEGRMIRGGGYEVEFRYIRSDFRHDAFDPLNEHELVGFRVAAIPATEPWLNTTVNGSGTISVAEGWQAEGTNLPLVATPAEGWLFMGWSGDLLGGYETASTNLLMDGDKSVVAEFSDDADADGLTNSEEGTLGTDPRNSDTDMDTFGDGQEVANGGNPLVSDYWRIDHIRNNGSEYDLYPSNSVLDLQRGQAGFKVSDGTAWLWIQLEESEDLLTWTNVGDEVYWSIPVDSSNAFYRVRASH